MVRGVHPTRARERQREIPANTEVIPDTVIVSNLPATTTVSGTVTISQITNTVSVQVSHFSNPGTSTGSDAVFVYNTVSITGSVTVVGGTFTGSVTLSSNVTASLAAASVGGYNKKVSASLTTGAFTITTSPGTFGGYYFYNPNSSVAYLQMFDSASFTLGTTMPDLIYGIPISSGANISQYVNFTSAMTAAVASTPTGSASMSSSIVANFYYK